MEEDFFVYEEKLYIVLFISVQLHDPPHPDNILVCVILLEMYCSKSQSGSLNNEWHLQKTLLP